MGSERTILAQQALAEIATLDKLNIHAFADPTGLMPRALGRLAAAEREAVAVSLALLLDGLHQLGHGLDDEQR